MLAFTILAMITGALGLYAVNSVVESGRLVVHTYDKPLMAINYARLAQADFNALLAMDAAGVRVEESHYQALRASGQAWHPEER